jgi:hypothetical protein
MLMTIPLSTEIRIMKREHVILIINEVSSNTNTQAQMANNEFTQLWTTKLLLRAAITMKR